MPRKIKAFYIDSDGSANGQVLSSNGSVISWTTIAGVNTDAQYTWTNTHTFNASVLANTVNATSITTGATGTGTGGLVANVTTLFVGNNTVNAVHTNASYTINGTTFIANTLGVYHTGVVNASSVTVGTNFIANTTQVTLAAGTKLSANGGVGSAGQILTSNGATGSPYWATASGGGATLSDNTSSSSTHYPAMSTTSSGSWSSAIVSTTKLYYTPSTGQLNATIFNSLSDVNKKKNIETIVDALNTTLQLRGVTFNWVDNDQPSMGLIAQELSDYIPSLVHTGEDGEMSINYNGVIGLLIEAIKQLNEKIKKLENK